MLAEHRVPAVAHRLPPAHALPRRAGQGPRRRAGADRAATPREGKARVDRPARQRGRVLPRAGRARARPAASGPTSSPTRPRRTTSSTATCRPAGASSSGARRRPTRRSTRALRDAAAQSCAAHVQAMLDFQAMGIPTVDYGNNIRQVAFDEGVKNAFDFPGFVPAYIRPLFCRGKGPFRWVALSGDPEDIRKTDAKMKELFPDDAHLHRWLDMAGERIAFQGLPARICWLGLGERHRAGLAFNEMVKSRRAEGADRDRPRPPRHRLGRVARTARPRRCRTAPTRSPTGRCSTRCSTPPAAPPGSSLHHGGGVGMGYSQHAGVVIVCDGTDAAAKRIERVLWNDPATGVMRHADAGYDDAIACATRAGAEPADARREPAWHDTPRRSTAHAAAQLTLDDAAGDPRRRRRARARRAARARRSAPAPPWCSARRRATRRSTASTPASASSPARASAQRDLGDAAAQPDPLAQRRRRRAAGAARSCG